MHPQSTQLPLPLEDWQPVVGYEGWYEVSSLGRVRRTMAIAGARTGRVLQVFANNDGYLRVTLSRYKRERHMFIHRLVALAFLGPRPVGSQTNHRNGIKTDNRPDNLEWCTRSENILHAFRLGLQTPPKGEAHGRSKLSESNVRTIRRLRAGNTLGDLAAMFHVSTEQISKICRHQSWKHIP